MSIIEKSSALNLMGKVAIITGAASPLGAQTCRTLLRHNCLVLGIDQKAIPEDERLFSALGTHFQVLELDLEDAGAVEKVIKHAEERFWKQGFDILIDFPSEDGRQGRGSENLREEISRIMSEGEGGVVLTVAKGGDKEESAKELSLAAGSSQDSVRSNVVLLQSTSDVGEHATLSPPANAGADVQECVIRFRNVEEHKSDAASRNRGIADLLLYLSTDLAKEVSGAEITADGRWKKF